MNVSPTLAQYSDLSFYSAVAVYSIALVVAVAFYLQASVAPAVAERRQLALARVGGAATPTDELAGSESDASAPAGTQSASAAKAAPASRRSAKLRETTRLLVWLAIILQAASVVLRGLATSRFPWGNLYEYISLTTLMAMVVASIILYRRNLNALWPWILTPIILLLFYGGTKLMVTAGPVNPALKSYWLVVHVTIVSMGAGVGLISGIASVMYLIRCAQPIGKEHGTLGKLARPLPSAKTLDMVAYKCAIWALPIFGVGIVLGALWANSAWGRYWNWDPKETGSLITWLLYAAYLHARATSGWRDKKAAWINIVAFASMLFNLFFINLVTTGLHSYAGLN